MVELGYICTTRYLHAAVVFLFIIKSSTLFKFTIAMLCATIGRGVGDGWAGWAIVHPGFGRSADGQIVPPTLLLYPFLGNFQRP